MDIKKALLLTTAAVLVYTLIAHPTQLGDGVQEVLGWLTGGVEAVVAFLRSIVT